jgi:peptidoglycan-associated lipoprotein
MTQKLLIITTLAALLFSGCAQTAPDAPGANNVSGTDAISGDTVSINENNYGNENANGMDANGNYNSSSDGFRSIYFTFGDYSIPSSMETNMNTNMQVATSAGAKIKIEGNCDEFGTDEYNYALGLKRAKAVKDSLVAQGVASSKMIMVSFGESSPVCQTPSDSCYDRNRRVDIRLVR